jgi:hypothetical protein
MGKYTVQKLVYLDEERDKTLQEAVDRKIADNKNSAIRKGIDLLKEHMPRKKIAVE